MREGSWKLRRRSDGTSKRFLLISAQRAGRLHPHDRGLPKRPCPVCRGNTHNSSSLTSKARSGLSVWSRSLRATGEAPLQARDGKYCRSSRRSSVGPHVRQNRLQPDGENLPAPPPIGRTARPHAGKGTEPSSTRSRRYVIESRSPCWRGLACARTRFGCCAGATSISNEARSVFAARAARSRTCQSSTTSS